MGGPPDRHGAVPGFAAGSLSAGSRLAGYEIEERVGHGGMAVVFRARDVRLRRTVALKVMAPALAADDAFRRRFVRESLAAAAVDHPHVIPVYEASEADGVLFIAMRYVSGGDVRHLISLNGQLSSARTTAVVSPVASALDAAHEAGLVHRDVKPANMLLDVQAGRPDHVYLTDFGLTKVPMPSVGLTGSLIMGTPDYMSPEQISGRAVDGRADQYSLACAAYEMLCGQPPFHRDNVVAVVDAQRHEPPPRPTSRRPGLPSAVDAVLVKALAKNPLDRYASCGEFAEALRSALGLQRYDAQRESGSGQPRRGGSDRSVPPSGLPDGPGFTRRADPIPPAARPPVTVRAGPGPGAARPGPPPPDGRRDVPAGHLRPSRLSRPLPRATATAPRRARGMAVVGAAVLALGGALAAIALYAHSGRSYKPIRALVDPTSGGTGAQTVAFSQDGRFVAVGDGNSQATYLWNAANGRLEGTLIASGQYRVSSFAFLAGHRVLAVAYASGNTCLWNVQAGRKIAFLKDAQIPEYPQNMGAYVLAFSQRRQLLAVGDGNDYVYLWNVRDHRTVGTLPYNGFNYNGVGGVAFSPDGRYLAVDYSNDRVWLWNVRTRHRVAVLSDSNANSLEFSPDDKVLAISDGQEAYLWNVRSRITMASFTNGQGTGFSGAVFSPNGKILATPDQDGSTYLWNIATGRRLAVLTDPGPSQGVEAVAFSPDGKVLATADGNGTTYLWSMKHLSL